MKILFNVNDADKRARNELIECKKRGEFAVIDLGFAQIATTDDIPDDFEYMSIDDIYKDIYYAIISRKMEYLDRATSGLDPIRDGDISYTKDAIKRSIVKKIKADNDDIEKTLDQLIDCKSKGSFGVVEFSPNLIATVDDVPKGYEEMNRNDVYNAITKVINERYLKLISERDVKRIGNGDGSSIRK